MPDHPKRPVADDPGAKKRRRLSVPEFLRNSIGERFGNREVFGVSTVGAQSRENGVRAKILAPAQAEPAEAARPVKPGDADPVSDREPPCPLPCPGNGPHDLVARDAWQTHTGQFAFDRMEVGVADAAARDLDEKLPRPRHGNRDVPALEGPALDGTERTEDHRFQGLPLRAGPATALTIFA